MRLRAADFHSVACCSASGSVPTYAAASLSVISLRPSGTQLGRALWSGPRFSPWGPLSWPPCSRLTAIGQHVGAGTRAFVRVDRPAHHTVLQRLDRIGDLDQFAGS